MKRHVTSLFGAVLALALLSMGCGCSGPGKTAADSQADGPGPGGAGPATPAVATEVYEAIAHWGGNPAGMAGKDGYLNGVHGVAIGPDGLVYAVDQANSRIQVFMPDGAF